MLLSSTSDTVVMLHKAHNIHHIKLSCHHLVDFSICGGLIDRGEREEFVRAVESVGCVTHVLLVISTGREVTGPERLVIIGVGHHVIVLSWEGNILHLQGIKVN
jgi:hypothetical protein